MQAIDFRRKTDARFAVHFSIALVHYGLLNTPATIKAPMRTLGHISMVFIIVAVEQRDGVWVFNFALLIERYVRAFAVNDAREAVHYYFLLR